MHNCVVGGVVDRAALRRRAGRAGPVAPGVQRHRRRGALAHHRRAGGTGIPARLKIADGPLAHLSSRSHPTSEGAVRRGVAAQKLICGKKRGGLREGVVAMGGAAAPPYRD